jgi:hypothetical protein
MRPSVLILIAITTSNLANAREALRVDGVPIYGNVHAVTRAGIRQAIREATEYPGRKPRALEILNDKEIHAYKPQRDLGWVTVRLLAVRGDPKDLRWFAGDCCGIQDPPDALRIIQAAEQVYIFPIKNSWKPYRDNKHMRLLDQKARKELVHFLSHRSDWWEGAYHLVDVEPKREIGFVFERGRNEVVLFFSGDTVEGTLNGKNTSGMLDRKRHEQFEAWKRRYAQPELRGN